MTLAKLIKSSLGAAVLVSLATAHKADALTIIPTYDPSLSAFGTTNLTALENATQQVINQYDNLFTNNVTLNIDIKAMASGLGQSQYSGYYTVENYSTLRTALINNDSALSTSPSSLPTNDPLINSSLTNPPLTTTTFFMANAEAKAVGFPYTNALINGYDGIFSISDSSSTPYTFCTTSVTCTIASGTYDYDAVAEHEISEIMGRTPGITMSGKYYASPYDLFRFTGTGVRSVNTNASNVYFSTNNGTTNLNTFNNHINGGDIQDWGSRTNDAFNAFASSGVINAFSPVDLTAMNAIGWKLNSGAVSSVSSSFKTPVLGISVSSTNAVPEPLVSPGAALGGIMFLGVSALMKRKK